MIDYGQPIRIFYCNLLRMGITMKVKDGTLRVGGRVDLCTPVLQDEIAKRADGLIAILAPSVPDQLRPFFYRLISVDEVKAAIDIADELEISLRSTPANGGWLLEILPYTVKPQTKKEKVTR